MPYAYKKIRDSADISSHTHQKFDIRQFQRAVTSQNIQRQFLENSYQHKKLRRFFYLILQKIFFSKQQTRTQIIEHCFVPFKQN